MEIGKWFGIAETLVMLRHAIYHQESYFWITDTEKIV
jgi:hypothetical protein